MKIYILGAPVKQTRDPNVDPDAANWGFIDQIGAVSAMMTNKGHEVIHVGAGGSDPICTKNVDVIPEDEWISFYKKKWNEPDPSGTKYWAFIREYERKARNVLNEADPRTAIVCAHAAVYHKDLVSGLPQYVVQTGVGYANQRLWADYNTFHSYACMNMYYGRIDRGSSCSWYDCVIPPAFDTSYFKCVEDKDDYFLVACKLQESKGVHIAADLAKKMGFKLKIAGPGDPSPYLISSNIEYLGVLAPKDRNEVMGRARGLLSPSTYLEPFGMVVIEANLCGTPVITTDWGGFVENVNNGVSGYRCRTWADFQSAVRNIDKLDPKKCREWGENYSYDKISPLYERYFQDLLNLNGKGWYTE